MSYEIEYAIQHKDEVKEWDTAPIIDESVLESDEHGKVTTRRTGMHEIHSIMIPRDEEWSGCLEIRFGGISAWRIPVPLILALTREICESHWKILVLPPRLLNACIDRNVVLMDKFEVIVTINERTNPSHPFRVQTYFSELPEHIPHAWLIRDYSEEVQLGSGDAFEADTHTVFGTGFVLKLSDPVQFVWVCGRTVKEYSWQTPSKLVYIPADGSFDDPVAWNDDLAYTRSRAKCAIEFGVTIRWIEVYQIGINALMGRAMCRCVSN